MDVKEFKTWKEQVAKLIEHSCIDIKSDEFAIDILKKVNYYRLTPYFYLFVRKHRNMILIRFSLEKDL